MKYRFFNLIVISTMFVSCEVKENNELISVDLKSKDSCQIAFENHFQTVPFIFIHEEYPLYYKYLKSKHVNIPFENYYLVMAYTDPKKMIYELNQKGFINKKKYSIMAKRARLDTIMESKKPKFHYLIAAVGFLNDIPYYSIDTNQDSDFSDEDIIPLQSDSDSNKLKHSNLYEFNYGKYTDSGSQYYKRKISIVSKPEYYVFQRIKDTVARQLGIVGIFDDYWEGKINIKKANYTVAIQGYHDSYLNILIKNDTLNFDSIDIMYNKNFNYKLKDTIQLENCFLTLDSINKKIDRLFFRLINQKVNNSYGFRFGEKARTYRLKNLNGGYFYTSPTPNKKFILLQFWGSWCLPCREMTPELKELYNNYSDYLDIVGVSYDESLIKTEQYLLENNINWEQSFTQFGDSSRILGELKINAYPTLILMDTDNRIVYRGSDISSIKKIKKILVSSIN